MGHLRPDWGGVQHLPSLVEAQFALVAAMVVGQLTFLAMWALLPWWREVVGRALMVKSAALGLFMATSLVTSMIILRLGPKHWIDVVVTINSALVTFGIWSQVAALAYEMREGYLNRLAAAEMKAEMEEER